MFIIPAASLPIEDCLREREPGRLPLVGTGEFHFRRRHCCKSPKHLIIISLEKISVDRTVW